MVDSGEGITGVRQMGILKWTTQAQLRDVTCLVPDQCNKESFAIK